MHRTKIQPGSGKLCEIKPYGYGKWDHRFYSVHKARTHTHRRMQIELTWEVEADGRQKRWNLSESTRNTHILNMYLCSHAMVIILPEVLSTVCLTFGAIVVGNLAAGWWSHISISNRNKWHLNFVASHTISTATTQYWINYLHRSGFLLRDHRRRLHSPHAAKHYTLQWKEKQMKKCCSDE